MRRLVGVLGIALLAWAALSVNASTRAAGPAPAGIAARGVPELEAQLIAGMNGERGRSGEGALAYHDDLVDLARARSADMIERGYFAHTSPDGLSPFDAMEQAGLSFGAAAENIAYNYEPPDRSAAAVLQAFMHSDGHRENILNLAFTHVGVGAVRDTEGRTYYTVLLMEEW